LLDIIEERLPDFIERNTWRELCREWLLLASARGQIPVSVEEVGSEWAKNYTIDVAGISEAESSMVLGDCYWQGPEDDLQAIEDLVAKTTNIVPAKSGQWRIYYLLFSAKGWSDEARARAEEIAKASSRKRRWQLAGIRLLDLAELDADLELWSI
jgi:hypothetical protein